MVMQKEMHFSTAREFNESVTKQSEILQLLRTQPVTKLHYEQTVRRDGGRLAPIIEKLRNAHGFKIEGTGKKKEPYYMVNRYQSPTMAEVDGNMKRLYYETRHWSTTRSERYSIDDYSCVLCFSKENLQCHHVTYENLFDENMSDLMTVCKDCHEVITVNCKMKFPSGINPEQARTIGWKGFDSWLLP